MVEQTPGLTWTRDELNDVIEAIPFDFSIRPSNRW